MGSRTYEFSPDFVIVGIHGLSDLDAIEKTVDQIIEKKIVGPEYKDAIIGREKTYPTGLPTKGQGVAMPHTDGEFVNVESFFVSVLNKPVYFKEMGNSRNTVKVRILFIPIMKNSKSQLEMLQVIVNLIQNETLVDQIANEKDPKEVYDIISKEIEKMEFEF
ncbi:PTS sugar transporter subunit IIA [Alkalibacter mobilis]|uniref:PTS sugar transporter subunit IIA n=1 Tax=Alkalibacter mobilis TaxID=2787712 RepID=UPI00189FB6AE|nr:PTS sugar transporter subunit IIA [Alkalibacter mobilis]MBF7096091.1 PTS sugar transporter subunit IIA [Alkalibacter mobilis]